MPLLILTSSHYIFSNLSSYERVSPSVNHIQDKYRVVSVTPVTHLFSVETGCYLWLHKQLPVNQTDMHGAECNHSLKLTPRPPPLAGVLSPVHLAHTHQPHVNPLHFTFCLLSPLVPSSLACLHSTHLDSVTFKFHSFCCFSLHNLPTPWKICWVWGSA